MCSHVVSLVMGYARWLSVECCARRGRRGAGPGARGGGGGGRLALGATGPGGYGPWGLRSLQARTQVSGGAPEHRFYYLVSSGYDQLELFHFSLR